MKNKLLKLKYKPNKMEDVILLPRVKKIIKNGITDHTVFHGPYGMGKNSLLDVMMKDENCLYLNTSEETSIEVLRNRISDFCSKMSVFDSKNDMKYVFFDEIDGASSNYQDALKAFIEKNEMKVRFIATTNYINRVDGGLLDRFRLVNFSALNGEEEKYLKVNYAKRVKEISDKEKIDIKVEDIKNIVNKNFPSFRKVLSSLQYIKEVGSTEEGMSIMDKSVNEKLYTHILNKDWDTEKCYEFLMSRFGSESIDDMINMLSRPFIEWYATNNKDKVRLLGDVLVKVTKYGDILNSNKVLDPIIIGITLIHEIRKIII